MGPTASGKTTLAIKLAEKLPIDIISVDSAMIYRGMDIGTGKPNAAELKIAPHALIDILDPIESYSAAQFCQEAYSQMEQSIGQGRIPMLVGGTMMYFNALQQGLSQLPAADNVIREKLLAAAEQHGWQDMHARLQKLDPIAARNIHPNDSQRIERALEVIEVTGKAFSAQLIDRKSQLAGWEIKKFALAPANRDILHANIAKRFHAMLALGFIEEVNVLFQRKDLHIGLPSIRSVGYRQIWQFLAGELSKQEMIDKSIAATRQLAKRQFTWLRRWTDLQWLDSDNICSCLYISFI